MMFGRIRLCSTLLAAPFIFAPHAGAVEALGNLPSPASALVAMSPPASHHATAGLASLQETARKNRGIAIEQETQRRAATHRELYKTLPDRTPTQKDYEAWAKERDTYSLYTLAQFHTAANHPSEETGQGLQYLKEAARHGHQSALYRLGHIYRTGFLVQKDLTTSSRYFMRASEAGGSLASTMLADHYREGRGVPQDYAKAHEYYEQAAALGASGGLLGLGRLYRDGLGTEVDIERALHFINLANDHANSGAGNNAAHIYIHGLGGVERDLHEALKHIEQSVLLNDSWACISMANFLWDGQWTEELPLVKDPVRACQLYAIAAEQAHPSGFMGLARCTATGLDNNPPDLAQAKQLFREGLRRGYKPQADALGEWAKTFDAFE